MSSINNNNNNRDPADFSVRTQEQQQIRSAGDQQPFQIELTDAEKRVLNECKKESLMYRSIPLMFTNCSLYHLATQRNLISKQGYFMKQLFILSISYFMGSFSYVNECKKKAIRELPPDSNLVRVFNKQPLLPQQQQQQAVQIPSTIDQSQSSIKPEGFTSYDELRQRNREQKQRIDFPTKPAPPSAQPDSLGTTDDQGWTGFNTKPKSPQQQQQQPPPAPEQYTEKQRKFRKNQYGDIIYGDE